MAKIRLWVELEVSHAQLVNPEKFPDRTDLFELGKVMLQDDLAYAIENDEFDDLVQWETLSE